MFRTGNTDLSGNVSFSTAPGTADGKRFNKLTLPYTSPLQWEFAMVKLFYKHINDLTQTHFHRIPSEGKDYTAPAPSPLVVVFGVGDVEAFVDIPITDDSILEDVEVFFAVLVSDAPNVIVANESDSAVVTINDNDGRFTGIISDSFKINVSIILFYYFRFVFTNTNTSF